MVNIIISAIDPDYDANHYSGNSLSLTHSLDLFPSNSTPPPHPPHTLGHPFKVLNCVLGHSMPNQHKKQTTLQISTKLGLQLVPHDSLAHTKFLPQKLYNFCFTALQKLAFWCIFCYTESHEADHNFFCAALEQTILIRKCSFLRALSCELAKLMSLLVKGQRSVLITLINVLTKIFCLTFSTSKKFGFGTAMGLHDFRVILTQLHGVTKINCISSFVKHFRGNPLLQALENSLLI